MDSNSPPARGDPEAECEALGDRYAATREAYQAGTTASSTAWNAYINAHNADQPGRVTASRLKQAYDRIAADLDRSLAAIAAGERAARDFEALRMGLCDLDQVRGNRYRDVQPAKG